MAITIETSGRSVNDVLVDLHGLIDEITEKHCDNCQEWFCSEYCCHLYCQKEVWHSEISKSYR